MKVQISFELDEDQRIAVGLMETGRFVPASREEVRSFVRETAMRTINSATGVVTEQRLKLAEEIKASLGIVPKVGEAIE